MRLKFIVIREEDQNKLHRFLNQESEKGWHATKLSFFHIRFDMTQISGIITKFSPIILHVPLELALIH